MNFSEIAAATTKGYLKAVRVFPVIGDVKEFDSITDAWKYALEKWVGFKNEV